MTSRLTDNFIGTRSTSKHCNATISTTTSSTSTTTKRLVGSDQVSTPKRPRKSSSESDRELLDQVTLKAKLLPISLQTPNFNHVGPYSSLFRFALCLASLNFACLSNSRDEFLLPDLYAKCERSQSENSLPRETSAPMYSTPMMSVWQYHALPRQVFCLVSAHFLNSLLFCTINMQVLWSGILLKRRQKGPDPDSLLRVNLGGLESQHLYARYDN